MSANDKLAAAVHPAKTQDRGGIGTDLTHPKLTEQERVTVAAMIRRRHPEHATALLAALGLEDA